MALLLLGGLVAAATILGGIYALCLWRFRRSSYSRLSGSVPGSTEKLVTSTEVSIYESREEGGLRDNNKDNEQSRIDAAERKEKVAGKDQLHGPGHVKKDVESTSESTESSEVGDHESRPLLSGSAPKEAAKYGIASQGREVNHEVQLHTAAPTHVPTKEKSTPDRSGLGFDDASVETAGEQTAKSLEISTVADTTTTTSTTATPLLPAAPSETIEEQKPPVMREKDEPADVSSEIAAEKPQELEPLIDLTSDDGDGGAGTLLSPAQTSEVQAVKSGFTDSSSSQIVESEKSVPSVNSGTSALITTEGAASKEPSIADKLNALFQPKQQKETEDLKEHTQTFPPLTRSPLPAVPQVPPKPAPRKSRPTSDSSPRPMSSASPGGAPPPVASKPTGQARKQVFSSPSAVPVLPMAFGKGGGFVPPVLRRKAEVSNGTGEEGQTGVRLPPMGAMFMGGGFGARPGSEGAGVEEPTSFDEPTKVATLYSPSRDRNKGPSNRRLPSRHSSSHE